MTEPSNNTDRASVIRWAAYLGSSWTWCIGMFLPVLLIRDYGTLGFVVFAVPNVIGAAAMGWTLRGEDASRRMVGAHGKAMRAFSMVTSLFQVYFLFSFLPLAFKGAFDNGPLVGYLCVAGMGVIATMTLLERRAGKGGGWTGLVVWAFSIAMGVMAYQTHVLDSSILTMYRAPGSTPDTLWLGMSCLFGFSLCPYLDLTFHKAWQGAGSGRRAAFGFGFGFFFLVMIVLTALYARDLLTAFVSMAGTMALLPVLLHMAGQLTFTGLVHDGEQRRLRAQAREDRTHDPLVSRTMIVVELAAFLLFGVGLFWVRAPQPDPEKFEFIYRIFMSFYGLLFPAYVLICMIPTWRNPLPPTRRQVFAWLASVVVASPMMYMAFIEKRMWWVGPALAVVCIASRVSPGRRGAADAE